MTTRAASNSRSASPSDRALPFSSSRHHADDFAPRPRLFDYAGDGPPPPGNWGSAPRRREVSASDESARHDRSRLPSFALPRPERSDWQTLPPLGSGAPRRLESPPALPPWASSGRMPPPRLSQSIDSPHILRPPASDYVPTQHRHVGPPVTPHRPLSPPQGHANGRSAMPQEAMRPPVPGFSADYPLRRQTRSRSNSLRRASSTDGYYGDPPSGSYREPPHALTPAASTPDQEQRRYSGAWDDGSPVKEEWGARSVPTQTSWGKLPMRGHSEAPPPRASPYVLPPLSSITSSLNPSPNHAALPGPSPAQSQNLPAMPIKRFSNAVTVSHKRTWTDLASAERRDAVQKVLGRYMRARAIAARRSPGSPGTTNEWEDPDDRFFVTITCSHSGVAQKSYGHEKRFLCPPPIVRVRGPGFTKPAATPDGLRHLRMTILPGAAGQESGFFKGPSSAEPTNQVVSEDITLDRTLHAKFGHLHVGSSTSNAKTFKLQLDMVKTVPSGPTHPPDERRYKSPRLSDSSDSYYGSSHGLDGTDHSSASRGLRGLSVPGGGPHTMMLRQHNWLTCESDAISVISKPSKKTTKAKTSSSQITPHLAICLFNRVNSQNVRTKYMAVDDGQLSARNDSWTSFFMRPLHMAGQGHKRYPSAVTYGSVIVLEVPGQGAVSDPLVVCKVEKGRIVVPAAFSEDVMRPSGSMHPPPPQNDYLEGPISQMQKVAFMRYEPPQPPVQGRGGYPVPAPRPPRTFLCSAPPDPWWRPMGAPTEYPGTATQSTAPMRPVSSLSQRPDLSSPFLPHSPSGSIPSDSHQPWMQRRSSSSSPSRQMPRSEEPSVLRSSSTNRQGMAVVEPLAPSPLTFLPAGQDETRTAGVPVKDQDVADDAFCWSVVGAAHFEYSFMRVGHVVESEEMAPPTESPVGCLPRLLGAPQYSIETHSLRLRGEHLIETAARGSASLPFEVWVGGLGPLLTETLPPTSTRGAPSSPPLMSVRLPLMMELINYAMAVETDVIGADHPGQRMPGPANASGILPKLPILLVREGDGLVCQTSFFVEVAQVPLPPRYPSGSYAAPAEWELRVVG